MSLSLPESIRLLLPDGTVKQLDLEEYVRGVVAAALPPDAPLEALKAQAVAARTFGAVTRRHGDRGEVCTARHCQVWQASASPRVARAVRETRGIVAVHDGRLIEAFYFDHCDGRTRDAAGILLPAPPYLHAVACSCGFATLKGHGVGMCQSGAMVMARFGDTFDFILKHYYSGITLEAVGEAERPAPAVEPRPKPAAVRRTPRARPRARHAPAQPTEIAPTEAGLATQAPRPASTTTETTASAQAPEALLPATTSTAEPTPEALLPATTSAAEPEPEALLPAATPRVDFAPIEAQPPASAAAAEPPSPVPAPEARPPVSAAKTRPQTAVPPTIPAEIGWYPVEEEIAGSESEDLQAVEEAPAALEALETLPPVSGMPVGSLPGGEGSTAPREIEPEASDLLAELTESALVHPLTEALPEALVEAPPPHSMPEPLPAFEVNPPALAKQEIAAAPPPPLVEAEITAAALPPPVEEPVVSAPPPLFEEKITSPGGAAPVLVDHLPGPRVIAGDLARPGIVVTIRDINGHAVVTVSGTARHYGAGGFEAPVDDDGLYAVSFDHRALQVELKDETVFLSATV